MSNMESGKKVLYFDCFSGISGDMACGALGHLTGMEEVPMEVLKSLHLREVSASLASAKSCGIMGRRLEINFNSEAQEERTLTTILKLVELSSLSLDVKEKVMHTFNLLAEAEGRVHGTSPDQVRFHEVGSVDSILDIAVFHQYISIINPHVIHCSPLPGGGGSVKTSHGEYPVPAPATIEVLKRMDAGLVNNNLPGEVVTPTGAVLIAACNAIFSKPPVIRLKGCGYGVGTREIESRPNILRVIEGELLYSPGKDRVYVLETNVDDMSPQHVEILMERVFEAGVLDFFITPVQMKKNRPGWLFTAILEEEYLGSALSSIFSSSTTTGIRVRETGRVKLERAPGSVRTVHGEVRVKVIEYPQGYFRAVPEYDDVKRISKEKGVSPRDLIWEVDRTWRRKK